MSFLLPVVLLLTFSAVSIITFLIVDPGDTAIARRLGEIRRSPWATPVEEEEMSASFRDRVLNPFILRFAKQARFLTPTGVRDRVAERLKQAGSPQSVEHYLGSQMLYSAAFVILTAAVSYKRLAAGDFVGYGSLAAAGTLGWMLPGFRLSAMLSQRTKKISRALPDVLDLLSVSVEAGLGFDASIQKVAEKFKDPIAGEFRTYLKEVRLGKTRAEALRNLSQRTGLPEMQTFIAAVVQADALGVSMAKVLKTQSEANRLRRKQKAEEQAMKLPLKMLFPLVGLIFPTLFIVILGPMVITFMNNFLN